MHLLQDFPIVTCQQLAIPNIIVALVVLNSLAAVQSSANRNKVRIPAGVVALYKLIEC